MTRTDGYVPAVRPAKVTTERPTNVTTERTANVTAERIANVRSAMAYVLGIDLGTSCTVAAINRAGGGTEVVALRVDTPGVPTVLHIADDGTMLVGAAAEPLILSDPEHVFRGFLHRLDEPSSPLRSPATLTARLVDWIVGAVAEQEGEPPQQITLTHPASWGPGECRLLHDALTEFGLAGVVLVPAPLATATAYAAEVGVAPGDVLAVYDLGTTFSTSLMRCESDDIKDITVLGEPRVLEDGGGARFDELVLARALDELGDQVEAADLDDQAMLAGMAGLLADCVTAREALSARPAVTIPVALPGLDARVRLTDDELETLVEPTLRATVDTLRAAISAAGLRLADVDTVLISGGCARMPLVAQLLTTELDRPVVVLTDPELATARGAALLAGRLEPSEVVAVLMPADATADDATADTAPIPRFHTNQPVAARDFRPRRRTLLVVAAGVLAVTTVAVPLTLLRAPDSGATPVTVADGDPGRGDRPPAYGAATAPPGAGTAGPTPADIPGDPARPSVVTPTTTRPAPQPIVAVPPPSEGTTTPPPSTTTPPPTTTTPPPTTTTPPPTTTTPPPSSTTTPPPSSTTTPPPSTIGTSP
ncbi:MAG: Hsp70 family protein [Pseudonocardiales bacterium]